MLQAVQLSGTGVCGRSYTQPLHMTLGNKLSTICGNSHQARESYFAVSLAVVDGDI
jgi:hypothetical protein